MLLPAAFSIMWQLLRSNVFAIIVMFSNYTYNIETKGKKSKAPRGELLKYVEKSSMDSLYLLLLRYEPSESIHATIMLTTIPMAPKSRKLASVFLLIQNTTTSPTMKPDSAA